VRLYLAIMSLIPADAAVRSSAGVRWAMAATTIAVLAADQVSKSLVLAANPAGPVGSGWVSVRLVRNSGAAGGLAAGHTPLVTLAALAVTGVAACFALRARGRGLATCLAAVLGGAAGNLADRLFRGPGLGRGAVVDWIHLGPGGGSMDISDLAIQFGVLGAVIAILVGDRVRGTRQDRQVSEAPLSPGRGQRWCWPSSGPARRRCSRCGGTGRRHCTATATG
jgi:signal peptidase II